MLVRFRSWRRAFSSTSSTLLLLLPLVCLVVSSAGVAQAPPASPNWAAIRAAVQESVVYVEALSRDADGANRDQRAGTGFVVSTHGHVLTALHTIPGPYPGPEPGRVRTITVAQTRHGPPIPAEIVRWDEQSDLVLLQVPRATTWRPLCFGDGTKVGAETLVWKLGYAGGAELSSMRAASVISMVQMASGTPRWP